MSASNNRASLLSGLRTGGVRSASGPVMPHTAAVGGSFQVPRFSSSQHQASNFDDGGDDYGQTLQFNGMNPYGVPMTAAIDGRAPRFQQQQPPSVQQQQLLRQAQIAAMSGMQGIVNPMDQSQAQFMQLQLMQAMVAQQQQAQKLQAEIALQQQVALVLAGQRQQQQQPRTSTSTSRMPSTAGPTQTSFDIRANAMSQLRNSRMSGVNEADEAGPVPMTAALGGKFGSRSLPTGLNPNAPTFKMASEADYSQPPPTPSSTVVISGGVSLGSSTNAPVNTPVAAAPSKSDSAVSWRRGSAPALNNNGRSVSPPKVISRRQSPPAVTVSSPEQIDKESTPTAATSLKYRPQPLRINGGAPSIPSVMIEDEDGHTVFSSNRNMLVNPPSPASSNSSNEGSRKYEGLGMGRPVVTTPQPSTSVRVSQPVRQPRGPPAGAEDLGMKNFSARIRRNITGPMMMEAVAVEAY